MKQMKTAVKTMLQLPGIVNARLKVAMGRAPRFAGAFRTRAAALASLDQTQQSGYDDAEIADVSFATMCQRESWDYPLIHWLRHILPQTETVIDAGGHLGTKYIAFAPVLDLTQTRWTVFDLPGIIVAARGKQAQGDLPQEIDFVDQMAALPTSDVLIASGLLQYLDVPFADFVNALPQKPRHILLNKVAVREGATLFTIERIGTGRVPYQVRSAQAWSHEIAALGYEIKDQWPIGGLGHVIATHPWRGQSESRGYYLALKGTEN